MARSSKPRKRYQGDKKRCHVPICAETRNALALDMHLSIESLILAPNHDTHYQLANMLSAMAGAIDYAGKEKISLRTDPDAVAVISAFNALIAIEKRFDKVGKWGISGDEAQTLRGAIGGLDTALARIPFNVLQASILRVSQMRAAHAAMAMAEQAALAAA